MGRATAYGLLRHGTRIAGATVFLPRPDILPLEDLPILARVEPGSSDEDLDHALAIYNKNPSGACLEVVLPDASAKTIREMGKRLAAALRRSRPDPDRPLVLLTSKNVGKALGHYTTEWGALPACVLVVDEVDPRGARFARIGRPRNDLLPVSFFGMNT
jgi:ethanolamine utilization protein EutA